MERQLSSLAHKVFMLVIVGCVDNKIIHLQIEVTAVIKDYESYQWQIFYRHLEENAPKEEKFIRANIVILSAGALGSTKILLESNTRGLEISSEVGRNFFSNGGVFGKIQFRFPRYTMPCILLNLFA